jgi:hypothetical protein
MWRGSVYEDDRLDCTQNTTNRSTKDYSKASATHFISIPLAIENKNIQKCFRNFLKEVQSEKVNVSL